MDGRTHYDKAIRQQATEHFGEGLGCEATEDLLAVSRETVRIWLDTYQSVGVEGLKVVGARHATYSFESKVARACGRRRGGDEGGGDSKVRHSLDDSA